MFWHAVFEYTKTQIKFQSYSRLSINKLWNFSLFPHKLSYYFRRFASSYRQVIVIAEIHCKRDNEDAYFFYRYLKKIYCQSASHGTGHTAPYLLSLNGKEHLSKYLLLFLKKERISLLQYIYIYIYIYKLIHFMWFIFVTHIGNTHKYHGTFIFITYLHLFGFN